MNQRIPLKSVEIVKGQETKLSVDSTVLKKHRTENTKQGL